MKKRSLATLLCLCMILSLLPFSALAADTGRTRVYYDANRGVVFHAAGNDTPADTAEDFLADSADAEHAVGETVKLLLDTSKALDWEQFDAGTTAFRMPDAFDNPALYVIARFGGSNGEWFDGPVVENGAVVREGFSLDGNVLSFVQPEGDIELDVCWSESEYLLKSFHGTDEKPVIVEVGSWNGTVNLPADVPAADQIVVGEMARFRVPIDTASVTFTWDADKRMESISGDGLGPDGQWGNAPLPDGSSYTLPLDQTWENGEAKTFYHLDFNFEPDWIEHDALLRVFYDQNRGSVFAGVGAQPQADAAHYLMEGWDGEITYAPDGSITEVQLLLDETRGLDWDAWYSEGEIAFRDADESGTREISIRARYQLADGDWFDDIVVRAGKAVQAGFTYENGVLSFTPVRDTGVELTIFWTKEDYAFDQFDGTEDKPIVIECRFWGEGEVKPPATVAPEDMIVQAERWRIRVSEGTKSVLVTWPEAAVVEWIAASLAEDGSDVDIPVPDEPQYLLQLNKTWSDGSPRDRYYITVQFEGERAPKDSELRVYYDQNQGSVFAAVNTTPWTTEGFYLRDSWDSFLRFDGFGASPEVHVLLDGTKAIDWQAYDADETIRFIGRDTDMSDVWIYARCKGADGAWIEDFVVKRSAAVREGFTYENGELTFTPFDATNVELEVYFSEADARFGAFRGTEDKPVVVECAWWGAGEVTLPDTIAPEDLIISGGRAKFRVGTDVQEVVLTWDDYMILNYIGVMGADDDGGWLNISDPEGTSYTLSLDQIRDDGTPEDYYRIEFGFQEVGDKGYAFVDYVCDEGSVFWGLGAPAETLDASTLAFSFAEHNYLTPEGEIGTIYLTLDPTRCTRWPELMQGNPQFYDLPARSDYAPSIHARYLGEDGLIVDRYLVENGVPAADVTFENNVLAFTPPTPEGIFFAVTWSQQEKVYREFAATDDKPVLVEFTASERGVLTLPDSIPAEDIVRFEGAELNYTKVRLPLSTTELPVSWDVEGAVGVFEYDDFRTDTGFVTIDHPAGTTAVIPLDQVWDGEPETQYYARFWFNAEQPHVHSLTPVAEVPATCTESGMAAYYRCEGCGKLFSDASGEHEIEAPAVLPALGHTWSEWASSKAPTCTEPGVESRICARDLSHIETREVAALGHDWGAWTVTKEPTATEPGVETRVCAHDASHVETREIPATGPVTPTNPFTDVPEGEYYYDAVLWAVSHDPQITNGTSPTTFSPTATCTRGQVVTFLWRAKGCPEPKSTANPFSDVAPGAYYYKAVLWANESGITNGTSPTTFSPDNPCTRAHVVTFLWRAEGQPAAGNANPFTDVPAGQYYTSAVLWAVSKNITNGTTAKTFSPDNPCTRGQIVTFLYRDMK